MRAIEQSLQNNQEKTITFEKIISNPAFVRFASGFELYQNLLQAEDNQDNKNMIKRRMAEIYADQSGGSSEAAAQSAIKLEVWQIINSVLLECEQNIFSKENFAEKIASSPITDLFLAEWNRGADEIEEGSGMVHVNNAIAYKIENNDEISLHIRPTGIKSAELNFKILDGFQTIAEKLNAKEIKANKIIMKSWLLNKKMEERAKLLLGDKISIEDAPPDDIDTIPIQYIALHYNNRSLEEYLKTGKKPEIRQVTMTMSEFIEQFKKL